MKRASISDNALSAARAFRQDMEGFFTLRIGETEAVLATLRARLVEAKAELAKHAETLAEREATVRDLESRIFSASVENDADYSGLVDRKNRMRRLAEASAVRVDELKRQVGRMPNEVANLTATLERLRAVADPDALDRRAVAVGVRAALSARARQSDDDAHELLAKRREQARQIHTDRDKPTVEAMARRGIAGRGERGSIRLGADVPDALSRLRRAGKISDAEIEAAGRYSDDYRYGTDGGSLVSSYDPRGGHSTGGGNRSEHVSVERISAFDRYRAARAAMPAEFVAPLEAILFQGVSLDSVPGAASSYAEGSSNRRAASGVLVICGLKRLAEFYKSEFGGYRA